MLPWEHSAILSTFIKLPMVIKIFVLSIFEWPFYTGFTVEIMIKLFAWIHIVLSISYHLSLRALFCLFLRGRFTQVLLYAYSALLFTGYEEVWRSKQNPTEMSTETVYEFCKYCLNRPPDKSVYLKIIFLLSQAKHMLWVLKRTVSMRQFF